MLALAPSAFTATCSSTGSGNWSAAIWSCAGGPINNDDIVINNTHTVTLNVNSANLGSGTINNGGILRGDGTGKILTIGKDGGEDFANNGTLNFSGANAATLRLNKNSRWGGTGTWNFSILDLNGKTLTFTPGASATLNFAGAAAPIINPGTVTSLTTITWNFTGTAAQTLPASASVQYGKLSVSNTAGVTMGIALTSANILDTLTVASNGIFSNGGFAITLAVNKAFSVENGATFNLTGTSTMAAVSGTGTKTFGATSTVNYGGANQAVTAETYGNLTLSGTGTKTPALGTTVVAGNFALSGGVTYAGTTNNPIVQFAGNFSNSGTFNSGTGAYTFNGTGAQSFSGATTFTNVVMSNSGTGLTLNNDLTVTTAAAGVLTLTQGVIITGSSKVVVGRACNLASVVRIGGYVGGNLQKRFPTGAVTCTFEVGDAGVPNAYAPVTIAFANVTVAGDLVGRTTSGDHPDIANSTISATLSVNRFWTLTNAAISFSTYSATFTYVVADNDSGTTPGSYLIGKGDGCTVAETGCTWTEPAVAGTPTNVSATASGMTSFSRFIVGERGVDHFAISHAGTGVNCQAEPVTVSVHRSNHNTVTGYAGTITLRTSTSHGDWSLFIGSGTFTAGASDSGQATYTYAAADNGVAVFNLRNTYAEILSININAGIAGAKTETTGSALASEDQSLEFKASGFRMSNGANAAATIGTQIASKNSDAGAAAQTLALQAIRTDTNTGTCVGAFPNNTEIVVETASECVNPATCVPTPGNKVTLTTQATSANSLAINNHNNGAALTYNNTLRFRFVGPNSEAPFRLNYPDAGQIRLYFRYNLPLENGSPSGTYMSGSSNAFVVRPFAMYTQISGNPGANTPSGTVFTSAGTNFSATVKAVVWQAADDGNNDGIPDSVADLSDNAATPNFAYATTLAAAAPYEPSSGTLGVLNNGGLAVGAYSGGIASPANLQYTEVGSFSLTTTVTDFLGDAAADVAGLALVVGRFSPHHFDVTKNTPRFQPACVSGEFSYIGQSFGYETGQEPVATVTAVNELGATTKNYTGTWRRLTNTTLTPASQLGRYVAFAGTLDTSGLPAVSGDPAIVDLTGGSLGSFTLTFSSTGGLKFTRTTPVAPFNADIGLSIDVIDADGIIYSSNPLTFGAATSGNGILFAGTGTPKQMRFGRLRLNNVFGSSLLDLPLPLSTQYYDGSFFVTNTADSCTALVASDIAFNFVGPLLGACDTHLNPSGALAFTSGKASVKLTKPGSTKNGAVDLTVNLGAVASGNTCTSATSSAATTANKPWLQGNWGSGSYNENPRGRATFGIYKNADQFLYLREVY